MNKIDSEMYLEAMAAFSFFNKVLLDAPDREYMQAVKENISLFDEWPFSVCDDSVNGLKLIKDYIEKYKEEDFSSLLDNFNRLFIGPGHLFAPPWESVYKEQDHTIFGESTLLVRNRYRKFGLEIFNINREPDDHIAYECAYMNYLCACAASDENPDKFREEIAGFIKDHPLSWIDEFTELMISNSKTGFYQGIGYMLRGSFTEAVALFS